MKTFEIALIAALVGCLIALGVAMIILACESWHLAAPATWIPYGEGSRVHLGRGPEEKRWLIASIYWIVGVVAYWFMLGFAYSKHLKEIIEELKTK